MAKRPRLYQSLKIVVVKFFFFEETGGIKTITQKRLEGRSMFFLLRTFLYAQLDTYKPELIWAKASTDKGRWKRRYKSGYA
ncbi:hypothetical protein ACJX0J_009928, partial [Zea mays]